MPRIQTTNETTKTKHMWLYTSDFLSTWDMSNISVIVHDMRQNTTSG